MDATKKIGFLIIGTNNYFGLAEQCAESIKQFVKIDDYEIDTFIWTNKDAGELCLIDLGQEKGFALNSQGLQAKDYFHISHLPWPLITLLRYQFFIEQERVLKDYDYLYYIDADMRVVAPVGKEILGERVACQHPGLYGQLGTSLPFEKNPKSNACINLKFPELIQPTAYYFGALQGGSSQEYLKACKIMRDWINADLKNNYIPVWHDESIWNKYCRLNEPDIILGKEYAYVDKWFRGTSLESIKKIEALEKDHEKFRKE